MKSKSLERILKPAGAVYHEDHPEYGHHVYIEEGTGTLLTGCTTISGAWKKEFIAPWYAKMCAEAIIEVPFENIKGLTEKDYINFVLDCKGAASRYSKQAQVDGTEAHKAAENAICAKIEGKTKYVVSPLTTPAAKYAFKAFVDWAKQVKPVWLASEELLASHEHKIAGTLDALASIDGIPTIVDLKTSSQVSEDYFIQLAGYSIMLQEMGFNTQQWMIVRIPKDGKPAETLTINDPHEMEFYKNTFLHLREAHRFFVYAKNHKKDARGKVRVDEKIEEVIPKKKTIKK